MVRETHQENYLQIHKLKFGTMTGIILFLIFAVVWIFISVSIIILIIFYGALWFCNIAFYFRKITWKEVYGDKNVKETVIKIYRGRSSVG